MSVQQDLLFRFYVGDFDRLLVERSGNPYALTGKGRDLVFCLIIDSVKRVLRVVVESVFGSNQKTLLDAGRFVISHVLHLLHHLLMAAVRSAEGVGNFTVEGLRFRRLRFFSGPSCDRTKCKNPNDNELSVSFHLGAGPFSFDSPYFLPKFILIETGPSESREFDRHLEMIGFSRFAKRMSFLPSRK